MRTFFYTLLLLCPFIAYAESGTTLDLLDFQHRLHPSRVEIIHHDTVTLYYFHPDGKPILCKKKVNHPNGQYSVTTRYADHNGFVRLVLIGSGTGRNDPSYRKSDTFSSDLAVAMSVCTVSVPANAIYETQGEWVFDWNILCNAEGRILLRRNAEFYEHPIQKDPTASVRRERDKAFEQYGVNDYELNLSTGTFMVFSVILGLAQGGFFIWLVVCAFKYLFRWDKMRLRWNGKARAPIMPYARLSALQNPLLLGETFRRTERLYGRRAACIQRRWIWLSYGMILVIIGLALGLLVYYLMAEIIFGVASAKGGGNGKEEIDPDNCYVNDALGNGDYLQRLSDNYYIGTSGETYQRCGNTYHRLNDMRPFN